MYISYKHNFTTIVLIICSCQICQKGCKYSERIRCETVIILKQISNIFSHKWRQKALFIKIYILGKFYISLYLFYIIIYSKNIGSDKALV